MHQFQSRSKRLFQGTLLTLLLSAPINGALADSQTRGSTASLAGSMKIIEGSSTISAGVSDLAQGSASLVVDSVTVVGDGVIIVLEGVGQVSRIILRGATDAMGVSIMAVGDTITAVFISAGLVLDREGEAIAFIPNETHLALAHSSNHQF